MLGLTEHIMLVSVSLGLGTLAVLALLGIPERWCYFWYVVVIISVSCFIKYQGL